MLEYQGTWYACLRLRLSLSLSPFFSTDFSDEQNATLVPNLLVVKTERLWRRVEETGSGLFIVAFRLEGKRRDVT